MVHGLTRLGCAGRVGQRAEEQQSTCDDAEDVMARVTLMPDLRRIVVGRGEALALALSSPAAGLRAQWLVPSCACVLGASRGLRQKQYR